MAERQLGRSVMFGELISPGLRLNSAHVLSIALKQLAEGSIMRPAPLIGLALPITPMLDMSFQLLAFFLFLFRPIPAEGQLAVMLPSSGVGQQNAIADEPPAAVDVYTVTIHSSPTGGLGTITLAGPTSTKENIRTIEALLTELKAIPKAAGVSLTIETSTDLLYARLVDVLDACKRTGFKDLKLGPIPVGRK
jgi:biopolymer transport protein ExbD